MINCHDLPGFVHRDRASPRMRSCEGKDNLFDFREKMCLKGNYPTMTLSSVATRAEDRYRAIWR